MRAAEQKRTARRREPWLQTWLSAWQLASFSAASTAPWLRGALRVAATASIPPPRHPTLPLSLPNVRCRLTLRWLPPLHPRRADGVAPTETHRQRRRRRFRFRPSQMAAVTRPQLHPWRQPAGGVLDRRRSAGVCAGAARPQVSAAQTATRLPFCESSRCRRDYPDHGRGDACRRCRRCPALVGCCRSRGALSWHVAGRLCQVSFLRAEVHSAHRHVWCVLWKWCVVVVV